MSLSLSFFHDKLFSLDFELLVTLFFELSSKKEDLKLLALNLPGMGFQTVQLLEEL